MSGEAKAAVVRTRSCEGVRQAPYDRHATAACRRPVAGPARAVQGGAVQTFLPHADFRRTAEVLDSPRLGKQRVETLQILRALELPEYGWGNHPAVRMWRGYTPALVCYGLTCVEVWRERGYGDSTAVQIGEFAPGVTAASRPDLERDGLLPGWLGDEALHRSHRSKLVAKDPAHYGPLFPDVRGDLDYVWPEPDEVPDPAPAPTGRHLWVLRPDSPAALGRFLELGVVGFGTGSGVDVDATGRELQELRDLVGAGRRRPGRPLLALSRFLQEVQVADEVAVLVQQGTALLVGEVVGEYEFAPRDDVGTRHRRRVRWDRLVPRSAVAPPSALQDVRPLFPVRLALEPAGGVSDG